MIRKATQFSALVLMTAVLCLSGIARDPSKRQVNLMPVPAKIAFGKGRLPVSKEFSVAFEGAAAERLKNYASRVLRRIEGRTVLELPRSFSADQSSASLVIKANAMAKHVPILGEDESYTLNVTNSQARLTAPNPIGAMRGLETFLQLLTSDSKGFYIPEVTIKDKPRFPWRGLLIDVARHYQPLDALKRNIDAMAAVKLNVLHWHLTEDQGFRVESKKFPKLHNLGSDGLFYTQDEIKEIVNYAADRGIRVVPEFDLPGHATSWLVAYPELGSLPGPYTIERRAGIFDPTLDPTRKEVYQFLDVFFGEMATLFPDKYMHIGGDENEGKHWDASEKIQAFMKKNQIKDNHELQTYFNKQVLKIFKKNGKTMMGWDEIFQPDLPRDVVIHSWRGQKSLAESARKGYFGVLSNGYYIDLIHPASKHYLVDPIPADTDLSDEEQKRILGGEATMWGEWVSPETIDSRIWPRTAAIAERFWSPRHIKDVDEMYRRLDIISIQLEELGLTHLKNRRMMLRRLSQNTDIWALEVLTELVEPVKLYQRYQLRKQTMLSPLTGLIDAAGPDAVRAREFNKLVERVLSAKSERDIEGLRKAFDLWRSASLAAQGEIERSAALHEAKGLAKDLEKLAAIGLEAVETLETGADPGEKWRERRL
ncbi:MAG: family 20 glycosylhydrolase, partial [Pyrinomonadaceae bacterium]|nr:family 20 glycosylhydrolase [Pyrinomonadaceae bacterium]